MFAFKSIRMYKGVFKLFFIGFSIVFFVKCSDTAITDKVETESKSSNQIVKIENHFTIELPNFFIEMNDINPQAILQYGFIKADIDTSSSFTDDEFYVTIIPFDKANMQKTLLDSNGVSLSDFNWRTAVNLELILEDFSAEIKSPKTSLINGLPCIQNTFFGRLGTYLVYYQMAVYETETQYYQLLTWCMQSQSNVHKTKMNDMINSFEKL